MKQCAFLTMDQLDDFEHYDYMLNEPLAKLGWKVSEISWKKRQVDWNRFEAVVIRTPWDYHHDSREFLKVLEEIDRSSARLENPLELIRWNIDKTYLRDLKNDGLPIVPTEWGNKQDQIEEDKLLACFDHFGTDEIVLKPTISAGADNTYRLTKQEAGEKSNELKQVFSNRAFMVQPLMDQILNEGEFSLIYFGEKYSHTLLKTPKENDFRVQEEHGGVLKSIEPEKSLRTISDDIIASIEPTPLYSRVDMVRDRERFLLIELELIEPSLYFNMDPDSPERFAHCFNEWMKVKV